MLRRRKLKIAAVTCRLWSRCSGLPRFPNASADGCTVDVTVAGGQTFTFQNVPPGTPPTALPLPVQLPDHQRLAVLPAGHRDHAGGDRDDHHAAATDDLDLNLDFDLDHAEAQPTSLDRHVDSTSTTTTTTTAPRRPTPDHGSGHGNGQKPTTLNPGTSQARGNGKPSRSRRPKQKPKKPNKPRRRRSPEAAAARDQERRPDAVEPDLLVLAARPGADRRPELLHRQLPDPAVPAPDLPGRRDPVRRAVAGAGRDQRDRDRLRPQPVGLHAPAPSAGCSSCPRPGRGGASTPTATGSPTRTTRSTRSSPPRATCTRPAPPRTSRQAIFAYNHAGWYVQSVLLRAKLIGGMPDAADRRADRPGPGPLPGRRPGQVRRRRRARSSPRSSVKTANAAIPIDSDPSSQGHVDLRQAGLAGDRRQRRQDRQGRQNASSWATTSSSRTPTGNIYTYAHLGSIPKRYPVPKPVKISAASSIAKALLAPAGPAPSRPPPPARSRPRRSPSTAKAAQRGRRRSPPSPARHRRRPDHGPASRHRRHAAGKRHAARLRDAPSQRRRHVAR